MTESIKPTKTVFTVGQYLDWQRQGTLDLSPVFQRRPVWRSPAKSLLIDSVVRGFPVPIILLRQVQDLETLSMKMEVVDGQQRLRTLLGFIDSDCLEDYQDEDDAFTVSRMHNAEIARKSFANLSDEDKHRILGYELSTHVFPATTSDALVFRMFARLNSTGLSLNKQEIRNSEFHGAFKSLVYELSFAYFDNWRNWGIFTNSAIARMDEAEAVSEYLMAMEEGIRGKSQPRISKYYKDNDDSYDSANIVKQRFESVMSAIENHLGDVIPDSAFERSALFYSLFVAIYHHMYGLKSPMARRKPNPLPAKLASRLRQTSGKVRSRKLSEKVQDAVDKATGDKARRDTRHTFLMSSLNLEPAFTAD